MINHKQADIGGQLDRETVEKLITETLGLSAGSARNYRKRLVGEGIVLPHPSNDESVVGDDAYEDILVAAAKQTDPSVNIPQTSPFPRSATRIPFRGFVDWAVEVNEWDSNEWFADDDIWLRQTWKLCSEIIKSVVLLKPNDNRYGRKMTNNEKMAGACEVVVKMARRMGDVSDGRVEAGKGHHSR